MLFYYNAFFLLVHIERKGVEVVLDYMCLYLCLGRMGGGYVSVGGERWGYVVSTYVDRWRGKRGNIEIDR